MKRLWVLLGTLIVLAVLAACGGATATPTGCVQLEDGRLVPTACPTLAVADDGPTIPPTDGVVTVLPIPTPPPPCVADDDSPEARGCDLFVSPPPEVGAQPLWCSTCHTIEGLSQGLIGPDLTHIGTDAATRKPGLSPEDYIRESIREPEVFICPVEVERCTLGLMTTAIVGGLTDEQVDDLVAFLLTLK